MSEFATVGDLAKEVTAYVAQLQAENTKLRELVKEAHLCMVNEGSCEDCYATHGECPIERGMCELGVDDGTE